MSELEVVYAPVAPNYVGKEGEILYGDSADYGKCWWIYSTFWGWSHAIVENPELYKKIPIGTEMNVGVVANIG